MTAPIDSTTAPATPAEHASVLHTIFADLEKALHLVTNPAIVALLPAKYQGYALAVSAVEQAVQSTTSPSSPSQ